MYIAFALTLEMLCKWCNFQGINVLILEGMVAKTASFLFGLMLLHFTHWQMMCISILSRGQLCFQILTWHKRLRLFSNYMLHRTYLENKQNLLCPVRNYKHGKPQPRSLIFDLKLWDFFWDAACKLTVRGILVFFFFFLNPCCSDSFLCSR